MIYGIGLDVLRVARIAKVHKRHGERFVDRLLHPLERKEYEAAKHPVQYLAKSFAVKEAFVKALGTGLQRELSSFEVDVSPQAVCPRIRLDDDDGRSSWNLRSFSPRSHYIAAVALDRDIEALEFFDWSSDALAARAANPFARQ